MLAHDRHGTPGAPPVLLLHGWPGDRHDMDAVAERLAADHDVVVVDLRGFGDSTAEAPTLPDAVGAPNQVEELGELLDALGVSDLVVGGYDIGSRTAQRLAKKRGDLVRALVLAPPFPGPGRRVLDPGQVPEWWYQSFHQLDLAERLIDGNVGAARAYLEHFWNHWSGPGWTPPATHLDRLAEVYGRPGAFTASISWYRAGSGMLAAATQEEAPAPEDRLATPLHALWPRHDPLFPAAWQDRLGEFFADVRVTELDCGHFVPVEAPDALADAIRAAR